MGNSPIFSTPARGPTRWRTRFATGPARPAPTAAPATLALTACAASGKGTDYQVGPGKASWIPILVTASADHPNDLVQLFVDRNRNGSFADDGPALAATTRAAKLVPWIYTSPLSSRRNGAPPGKYDRYTVSVVTPISAASSLGRYSISNSRDSLIKCFR